MANNQHDLGELSDSDILHTPFAKAIMQPTCAGTISLMTEGSAMPFERIWCIFEDYVSLVETVKKTNVHLLDISGIIPHKSQQIGGDIATSCRFNTRCAALLKDLGDGTFQDEGGDLADEGEHGCWFPANVASKAIRIDISSAKASNPSDKENIIRLIGKHKDYVNYTLRSRFAAAALYNYTCTLDVDSGQLDSLIKSRLLGNVTQARAKINATGALAGACQFGAATNGGDNRWLDAVEVLLSFGADPDAPDKEGQLPSHWAIKTSNYKALSKLLNAKSDPTKTVSGVRALDIATRVDDSRVWDTLAAHGWNRPEVRAEIVQSGPPVGSILVAKLFRPVFQSMYASKVVRKVKEGKAVKTSGQAMLVEGFEMVSIEPDGAVQLGPEYFSVGPVIQETLCPDGPVIGSTLVALKTMTIFQSCFSSQEIGQVKAGDILKTSGWCVSVDGFSMVPVDPTGAIQILAHHFDIMPPAPPNALANGPAIGSVLRALKETSVFASTSSTKIVGKLRSGDCVKTSNWVVVLDGFAMVSIDPEGAVELGSDRFEVGEVIKEDLVQKGPLIGSTLIAQQDMDIFASPYDDTIIAKVSKGEKLKTAGFARIVGGFEMAPVQQPKGAVQLGHCRFLVN